MDIITHPTPHPLPPPLVCPSLFEAPREPGVRASLQALQIECRSLAEMSSRYPEVRVGGGRGNDVGPGKYLQESVRSRPDPGDRGMKR